MYQSIREHQDFPQQPALAFFFRSDPVQSGSHRCHDALRKSEKVVKHAVTGLEVAGWRLSSRLEPGSRPPQPGLGQRDTHSLSLGSEEASAPFMARQCCELKWTCSIQCDSRSLSALPQRLPCRADKEDPYAKNTGLVLSSRLCSGDSWRPRKARWPTLFLFLFFFCHSTECSVTALAGDATS